MSKTISRHVRVLSIVAALSGAVALGGCSVHPGAAASATYTAADGTQHTSEYSLSEVGGACEDFQAIATCDQVLQAIVQSSVIDTVTSHYGVTVSDAQVEEALATFGVDASQASEGARVVGRMQAQMTAMQSLTDADLQAASAEVQTMMDSADVDVSPRFQLPGPWSLDTSQTALGTQDSDQDADQGN